jgi:hypothetical protein
MIFAVRMWVRTRFDADDAENVAATPMNCCTVVDQMVATVRAAAVTGIGLPDIAVRDVPNSQIPDPVMDAVPAAPNTVTIPE